MRGGPSRCTRNGLGLMRQILVIVVTLLAYAAVGNMNVFTLMCARSFGRELVPWRCAVGVRIVLVLRSADTESGLEISAQLTGAPTRPPRQLQHSLRALRDRMVAGEERSR